MRTRDGNKYQTGVSAHIFVVKNPLPDPEFTESTGRLGGLLGDFRTLAARQHEADVTGRALVRRQAELRLLFARVHLPHLASVGRLAARDLPELARTFSPRRMNSHLQFRTVTGTMVDAARANQDVLRKRGLSVTMLDDCDKALVEYDHLSEALSGHLSGRAGATADLHRVAKDIVAVVKVLDGHVRFHWQDDERMLAEWRTASTIRAADTPAASDPAPSGTTIPGGSSPTTGSAPATGGAAAADRPAA
jgi:hypothetical protein